MLGAIVGDYVGSRYEFNPIKIKDFDFDPDLAVWTDDSLMTIALADAVASGSEDYAGAMRRFGMEHVTSYGLHFWDWLRDPDMGPYGSWGNGGAMRVSPAAWFATDFQSCMALADAMTMTTHNHLEGVRAARATAAAVYAAMTGSSQDETKALIERLFGYDMSPTVDEFRETAAFEVKSWISVPRAIACALQATSFEDAVRNAVSLGGDADTEAAIAGAIAQGWFAIPAELSEPALARLPEDVREAYLRAAAAAAKVVRRPVSQTDLDTWEPTPVPPPPAVETPQTDTWLEIERSVNAPPPPVGLLRRLTTAMGLTAR